MDFDLDNGTSVEALSPKAPAFSKEGSVVAYVSLVIMALIPIYFGSFRSVKYLQKQQESGEKPEAMSHKEAAMFPLYASVALVTLYILFKVFSEEYINLLLAVYFFGLGSISLTYILRPFLERLVPGGLLIDHNFVYMKTDADNKKTEVFNFSFGTGHIAALAVSGVVGGYYLWKKHWVVNNVFGLAFALNGVEVLQINNLIVGCTLLGGLFIYDIFWVFGTDVMVTVAKSFEAPIKLVFPQDLFENMLGGKHFAMLGLGDIVIPGIFIALLLRFDMSLKRERYKYVYFYSSFVAYFIGLVITIGVMSYFKHAQPALLYLVPMCILVPLSVAFVRGDIPALFRYEDTPQTDKKDN